MSAPPKEVWVAISGESVHLAYESPGSEWERITGNRYHRYVLAPASPRPPTKPREDAMIQARLYLGSEATDGAVDNLARWFDGYADDHAAKAVAKEREPIPKESWHEDDGPALWWCFPIQEPPYCGSPLDSNFPDYVTHWTRLLVPVEPTGSKP